MPGGTGLLGFKEKFAQRFFDVGIAEEHAVSMAGGLAKQGMIPVVALYSTFLQRAYDMILQDICMLGLHVVFAVDRAGLVGEDGETHHGVFDVGFLRHAPNMLILSPASQNEFEQMMQWAIAQYNGPVAIRYPRGADRSYTDSAWKNAPEDSLAVHTEGKDAAIITYGTMLQNAMDAAALLQEEGKRVTVIRLMNLSQLPINALRVKLEGISHVFVAEEIAANCGISHALAYSLQDKNIYGFNLGDQYVPHGSVDKLYAHCGLDSRTIANRILEVLDHEN